MSRRVTFLAIVVISAALVLAAIWLGIKLDELIHAEFPPVPHPFQVTA